MFHAPEHLVSFPYTDSFLLAQFWLVEKRLHKTKSFYVNWVGIWHEQKVSLRNQHSIISNKIYSWNLVMPLLFQMAFLRILRNMFSLPVSFIKLLSPQAQAMHAP